LLRVSRRGGGWLALFALTSLAIAAMETLFPAVLGRTVDALFGHGSARTWVVLTGLLVLVLVGCDALDDVASGTITARSTAWLRVSLVGRMLLVGPRSRIAPGDVATRLVGNSADTGRVASDVIRAITNLLPGVGAIVALALIDPRLAIAFVVGMPILVVLVRSFARDLTAIVERYMNVQGRISARLVDALSGARTIASAGTAEREARRVLEPVPELHEYGVRHWRAEMKISAQDGILVALLEVIVLSIGGIELTHGRISPGEMLAAGEYVLLATSLRSAYSSVARLARSRAAAARADELLNEPAVPYGSLDAPPGDGTLQLRCVRARIGDRDALHHVEVDIPGGTLAAIVGRTGAGKSTFAQIAGRLRDPDEGEVLLDGVSLRHLSRDALRREIAYGFDRPSLFGDTMHDAIAFGLEQPSEDAVHDAARAARADEFITKMPDGYATALHEAPMSGGEVQRVGLARTFAHAGRLVILDDVAASLDTVTEHHIGRVLTEELAGRTRLIVAQRVSTAARADLVIWLEDGRVRAVAPHRELWTDPEYRAVFEHLAPAQDGSA